ncbi:MAG: C10 family peptidase [Bacteroidales bacterium]|nr:C10 family peptidase [Bacteroidales bacterium]
MKKTFLCFLLVLSGFWMAGATAVTPEKARKAAESFLLAQPRTKAGPVSLSLAWRLPDEKSNAGDLIYAFDNLTTGGFVIVSGEDAVSPVLGFSTTGRFPSLDMPEGMKYFMEFYGETIRYARQQGWSGSAAAAPFDPSQRVKLETAQWHQLAPYNKDCPIVNGSRPPVGCVATALGIIMNYHRWPERGTGELPSYSYTDSYGTHLIDGCTLGHPYDWDAINAANPDYDQIARLLHEIGVMVEMRYNGMGSGASHAYVSRLSQYFGYDKDIRLHERMYNYTDARWEALIREDIDANRPVFFVGYNEKDGGHAMVIDGYCGRYFSINFGWGFGYSGGNGYSNPEGAGIWFLMTPVEGYEKDRPPYYFNQDIICNIKPDAGGQGVEYGPYYHGRFSLPYDFSLGKSFTVMESIFSEKPAECCVVLTDASGKIKKQLSGKYAAGGNDDPTFGWKTVYFDCTLNQKPQAGEHLEIALYVDGKKVPVEHNREAEFWFRNAPPSEDLKIGYVTGNLANPQNEFLTQAIRDGRSWNVRESWHDFFYFCCYKDLVWQLISKEDGTVIWDSGELYDSNEQFGERPRFVSLLREDVFYNFIRLPQGDYVLRLKNPLTGENLSIDLTI